MSSPKQEEMKLDLSEFVRIFPLRAKNISWLFGAGTSVTAGLPSAYDLIWDFKRRIYCSEQGYPLSLFDNLSDRGIRTTIQNYFDSKDDCPAKNNTQEYSFYFERAYRSSVDRKKYLEGLLSGMHISYGHKVIGILMKHQHVNLIFTTNFDRAFENTAVQTFGNTESWFKTDLDSADNGLQLYQSNKVPLIVKLHGDYLSDNLKNTTSELQTQDSKLRHILNISSYLNGLGIMGYSGRDKSVMDTLFTVLNQDNCFPNGIFWFIKSDIEIPPIVEEFIIKAKSKGIEAYIIEIETFDTAWAEFLKGFDKLPAKDIENLNQNFYRKENKPLPKRGIRSPLIRLNAIQVSQFPISARLYVCDAGNTKEINELISSKKGDLIAIRKRMGIVGFGKDEEFARVFKEYGDYRIDLYEIPDRVLGYDDSSLKRLIIDSLSKALTLNRPLKSAKRRSKYFILPDYKNLDNPIFTSLKKELGGHISGKIPKTGITWIACIEISIQFKLNRAYLVMDPSILATKSEILEERRSVAPFIKELTARWYNDKYDRLLSLWVSILLQEKSELIIRAFGDFTNGVNASFKLGKTTAYTKTV